MNAQPEPHRPGPFEIETASGRYVDLFVPIAETIALEDIAHGLAHTCRFAGHVRTLYSVAEHAVLVSRKLEAEGYPHLAMAGLHHDDAEAYLGDLTRPLKLVLDRLIPEEAAFNYRDLEGWMDRSIARALAQPDEGPKLWKVEQFGDENLKDADEWAMLLEAAELMPSGGHTWGLEARWPLEKPIGWRYLIPTPDATAKAWLERHAELAGVPA